jgi:hypothetical protein
MTLIKEKEKKIVYSNILETYAHTLGYKDFNSLVPSFKAIELNNSNKHYSLEELYKKISKDYPVDTTIIEEYVSTISNEHSLASIDKDIYIDKFEMNLFDFRTIYFKRANNRRYSDSSSYLKIEEINGDNIWYVSKKNNFENLNTYLVIPRKQTWGHFYIIFIVDNENILLEYDVAVDFFLDIYEFMKESDFELDMNLDDKNDIHLFEVIIKHQEKFNDRHKISSDSIERF